MSYGRLPQKIIRRSCKTSRGCNKIHLVDEDTEKLALYSLQTKQSVDFQI